MTEHRKGPPKSGAPMRLGAPKGEGAVGRPPAKPPRQGFFKAMGSAMADGWNAAETTPSKPAQQTAATRLSLFGIVAANGSITFNGQKFPLAGARAFVEIGGIQRRTTATRVVVGSVITLGVGTIIGAMSKKKTNNIFVTVELADGQVIVVEGKAKDESSARQFAAALSSAGTQAK
ncbi:MAG: hypothetical protein WBA00_17200 [Rhodococcus sp. (in: high G+C Gram-positive bacteria)]